MDNISFSSVDIEGIIYNEKHGALTSNKILNTLNITCGKVNIAIKAPTGIMCQASRMFDITEQGNIYIGIVVRFEPKQDTVAFSIDHLGSRGLYIRENTDGKTILDSGKRIEIKFNKDFILSYKVIK